MMPGDMPCRAPCRNARCQWCAFGMCLDNVPCEEQMKGDER